MPREDRVFTGDGLRSNLPPRDLDLGGGGHLKKQSRLRHSLTPISPLVNVSVFENTSIPQTVADEEQNGVDGRKGNPLMSFPHLPSLESGSTRIPRWVAGGRCAGPRRSTAGAELDAQNVDNITRQNND